MVKSMTGYGRHVETIDNSRITVEVRTVNHRFLDLSIKMPKTLLHLEEKMKKMARQLLKRGRVDIFLSVDGEALENKKVDVDWILMDQYIEQLNKAKERYKMEGSIPVQALLQFEEVFTVTNEEDEGRKCADVILSCCEQAVQHALQMRKEEGAALKRDLIHRIQQIQSIIKQLEDDREQVIVHYRERIRQRIETYLEEELREDDSRVIQEVAILAEKGDITEEVTRLFSHVDQLATTLEKDEPIGRKLEFIVQEMHREANTIGSKSNDAMVSEKVVALKSEIEKVKEQVQNVE
ncbi:YicC/YloC family endoribonuclease [Salirhabdus salicampi]|uniref:YicC/YloC family endoribonuclease n=1 Tax=Salirhabdus salicampi TaxID=476102 RepID=UPI0020C512CB|nr:YicC/YloC family endoribonuclease [Salirhabdus salicampi]MCP8616578.1 YicC family protein [Salirhabdus salicampi]